MIRELIGNGTMFGAQIMGQAYVPFLLIILAPGAFMLLGSMLAGVAIAQTGTTVVHAMGYSLTFFNNIDHGKANGLLLCEYLNYVHTHNLKKMAGILETMGMKSLEELQALIKKQMKPSLTLTDEEISLYTEKALMAKSVENTVPKPTAADIRTLYRKSLGKL